MRQFLDDFLRTQTADAGRRAAFILASAKLEKSQFEEIKNKLQNKMSIDKIILDDVHTGDIVSGSYTHGKFMEMDMIIAEVFRRSNLASLLLDNYLGVLTADIKAMEDELAALEKSVNNYAFLLADNGAFDYAFLEGFNDERNREIDISVIPDRAGRNFTVDDWAIIDQNTSLLSMNDMAASTWPIPSVRMYKNNVSTLLATSDIKDLPTMTEPYGGSGWKVSVKSDVLIKGVMDEFPVSLKILGDSTGTPDPSGPQMILELTLASPSPCDTLKIIPFADWGFTLNQVQAFSDADEAIGTNRMLLSQPIQITEGCNLSFPNTSISKFRLYISQPVYRRTAMQPHAGEERNKRVFEEMESKNLIPNKRNRQDTVKALAGSHSSYGWYDQRMLMFLEDRNKKNKIDSPFAVSIPRADYRKSWGSFSFRSMSLERKTFEAQRELWNNEDWTTQMVADVIRSIADTEAIWATVMNTRQQVKPAWAATSGHLRTDRDSLMPPTMPSQDPQKVLGMGQAAATIPYTYKLGIKNVAIGLSSRKDRAVFLSKRVDAPGDIGTVRVKSDYTNIKAVDTDLDADRLTSIEYSVTNVSKPLREADWTPILPIDTSEVIGERLFPDIAGFCRLRFTAKIDAPLKVYINGYHKKDYNIKDIARRNQQNPLSYDALTLPVADFTSADILTVDYIPSHDFTTIDFAPLDPLATPPLVSSYDDDGAGEGFDGTSNQLVISLKHNPYIDYNQVDSATYIENQGLSGYSPITVRFTDGTIAYNFTNYKDGDQSLLDSGSSNYQYIHSGDTLMFNKTIDKPFRVFYQFQPSDVRVRIVLRCNYKDFVSPKVDYYQIKAKTKKADAKRKL